MTKADIVSEISKSTGIDKQTPLRTSPFLFKDVRLVGRLRVRS